MTSIKGRPLPRTPKRGGQQDPFHFSCLPKKTIPLYNTCARSINLKLFSHTELAESLSRRHTSLNISVERILQSLEERYTRKFRSSRTH